MNILQSIASLIQGAINRLVLALSPVGCIIGWHKSLFTSAPSLPANWVLCNGSVINNSSSPLNGKTTPNLTTNNYYLVGNTTSGTTVKSNTNTGAGTSFEGFSIVWIMRIY